MRNWNVFFCSVFFVLGFSFIFSLVGILLQTVLSGSSLEVQKWLGRVGGVFIIFFGLYIVGLIQPKFLQQEHKFQVKHKFKSKFITSFVFGAAFAVGWTPCVTAALGGILGLATSSPSSAFLLLMAYTLGLGMPFLLVGLFTNEAQRFIQRTGKWLHYANYFFGFILIVLGILVFTSQLSRIANLELLVNWLVMLNIASIGGEISSLTIINLGVAFLGGIISFLSPCVLPLIPGFLTYLASIGVKE